MSILIKEYGSLIAAIIGGIVSLVILFLFLSTMKTNSKYLIANMTGVTAEDVEYIYDDKE